jgi:hypothetical protein
MSFDKATRNRLARFVSDARDLLTAEFTRQLQHEYGLDPETGVVTELDKLTALDDSRRETASILRETMAYYLDGKVGDNKNRKAALTRILREQAFTVLNRLCALRLAEARDLILQAVGGGYQSQGFQLYARLAGPALGETGEAYRIFLFSIFDELAVELPPLFDRFSPEGRLFPRPTALLALLDLINDPDLEPLWAEDETIGWIYQYFNSQEERKAMRAASSAPRNSRELAVRNQFFTPRYVVEFLTDNTLGRIWYEMTKGETEMVDSCNYLVRRPTEIFLDEGREAPVGELSDEDISQEELLKQPVYIPHRPLKDPREIKMLDPACGSMHFGLYAFDLFERIYAEAWELEEHLGSNAFQRLTHLETLHETYPDKTAYTRDVPRLIIERNIHGVDIDPRAVQIAGLSLWLRAQKSWGVQGLHQQERPQISKSNIVCAEPMPGDQQMLDDFLNTLDEARLETLLRESLHLPLYSRLRVTPAMADALKGLVRTVWNEMELAGEAGSLLKIEKTLRDAITKARKNSEEKSPLFQVLEYGIGSDDQTKLDFWDYAEILVLAALQDYAEQAASGASYQRRLFAGDAAQGFAFIQLCQKLYDVVLMNPPFGNASKKALKYLAQLYKNWNKNVLCAFITRQNDLLTKNGFISSVIDRTILNKSTYEKFRRENFLDLNSLSQVLDLGWDVLDANVEVSSCIMGASSSTNSNTICIDVRQVSLEKKENVLIESLSKDLGYKNIYLHLTNGFGFLPNASIIYDLPNRLLQAFSEFKNLTQKGFTAYTGHQLQSERHFRNYWEISQHEVLSPDDNYCHFYNGGEYSRFTIAHREVVRFGKFGNLTSQNFPSYSYRIQNKNKHFLRGVGFGVRGEYLDAHLHPEAVLFSVEGQVLPIDDNQTSLFLVGLLNSALISRLLNTYAGQHKYSGYVNLIPFANPESNIKNRVANLTQKAIEIKRMYFASDETCLYFTTLLHKKTNSYLNHFNLSILGQALYETGMADLLSLNNIIEEIDQLISTLYKLTSEDFLFDIKPYSTRLPNEKLPGITPGIHQDTIIEVSNSLISYLTGIIFARWDIRYATGERTPPEVPDPFAPLPACPPGMLQNGHGLPAAREDMPPSYPLRISWSGILVDDEGHPEDIVGRTHETLQVIWEEKAEAIETEACEILGIGSLRDYFQKSSLFFADHLKRYSKSRRYAPIYWPLSTISGSYTLWLYYHRLTDQTLFTCVNDFVDPKLKQVAEDGARLRQKGARSSDEENELERLVDFESELKDFRAELLRVAAFWKPNLNDGVQITAAPLWRLFQHKPWQKKLRETWEKLEIGEYDWAHLAYSIWPKRVSEKCKIDKSLAIAHDLEHLYVEPPKKTKKSVKKKTTSAAQSEIFNDN